MTKSFIKTVFFFFIALFFTHCSYTYSEDYFNDVELPSPDINISLLGFTNGEVLNESRLVNYSITGSGGNLGDVLVEIDDDVIFNSSSRLGQFAIDVDRLENGNHELIISFEFPTNSGSLADSLQAELFSGTVTYSFTVDKSLADSFGIASVDIIQGSIFINLNPITDTNFDEAFLLIKKNGSVVEELLISQQQVNDLQIHDSETFFYNPEYAIKVKNTFEEKISDYVLLTTPQMELEQLPILYDNFDLIYSGHPLYGNFDSIGIEYSHLGVSGLEYLIPTGGTTNINRPFTFGLPVPMRLNFYKNGSFISDIFVELKLGENLPVSDFIDLTYDNSVDNYYVLSQTNSMLTMTELDRSSLTVNRNVNLATLLSQSDFKSLDILPSTNLLAINLKGKSLIFDTSSFSLIETILATSYNVNKANALVYVKGDYVVLDDDFSSGEVIIYDKITRIEKYRSAKMTNFFMANDASYFYVNGDLFELQSGTFNFSRTMRDSVNNRDALPLTYMAFDTANNTVVFGWFRDAYYLDLNSNNQNYIWGSGDVRSVNFTETGQPFMNSNHFSGGNRSHLYDVANNELLSIATLTLNKYFNGSIFSPSGVYLITDLYTN
jgi:hypothetical protein